jgi:hypothetical protein
MGHEAEHLPQLGRFHQLTVDAYGAQHAGTPTPPISTAFSLIGLHLALEDGWTGDAVRAAHQFLAGRHTSWPAFHRPNDLGPLTVTHVRTAPTPEAHAERVQAWAASVWEAWKPEHQHVRAWADAVLTPDVRGKMRSA